jgi:hypothetical protein
MTKYSTTTIFDKCHKIMFLYCNNKPAYTNFIIITESLYFIKCRWENEHFNTLHAAKALSRAWSFQITSATLTLRLGHLKTPRT